MKRVLKYERGCAWHRSRQESPLIDSLCLGEWGERNLCPSALSHTQNYVTLWPDVIYEAFPTEYVCVSMISHMQFPRDQSELV